jgi:hypothetical protein
MKLSGLFIYIPFDHLQYKQFLMPYVRKILGTRPGTVDAAAFPL